MNVTESYLESDPEPEYKSKDSTEVGRLVMIESLTHSENEAELLLLVVVY